MFVCFYQIDTMLTHINDDGAPHMVDVGTKHSSARMARARAIVSLPPEVLAELEANDLKTHKGVVFHTAIIAGIMAAKKTGELIPLCHPLPMDSCHIDIIINANREVQIDCTCRIEAKTGVEMEALTGASVAALTVYDMCKAMSQHIVIREVRLLEKRGGKRDFLSENTH
jgi:cyclic pyranopterin monophosphate synthase